MDIRIKMTISELDLTAMYWRFHNSAVSVCLDMLHKRYLLYKCDSCGSAYECHCMKGAVAPVH